MLFWGGVLSVTLITLGIVGFAVRGGLKPELVAEARRAEMREGARPPDVFVSVTEVVRALGRWPADPLAVVASGVLLLLVTPAAGVAAALMVFLRAGDRRYAGVALVLLLALLASLALLGYRR
jgi:uncharacterized membrane protein